MYFKNTLNDLLRLICRKTKQKQKKKIYISGTYVFISFGRLVNLLYTVNEDNNADVQKYNLLLFFSFFITQNVHMDRVREI